MEGRRTELERKNTMVCLITVYKTEIADIIMWKNQTDKQTDE